MLSDQTKAAVSRIAHMEAANIVHISALAGTAEQQGVI